MLNAGHSESSQSGSVEIGTAIHFDQQLIPVDVVRVHLALQPALVVLLELVGQVDALVFGGQQNFVQILFGRQTDKQRQAVVVRVELALAKQICAKENGVV